MCYSQQVVATQSVLGVSLELAPWSGPVTGLISCPGVWWCERLLIGRSATSVVSADLEM